MLNSPKNGNSYPILESNILAANLSVFEEVYPINVFDFKSLEYLSDTPLYELTFEGQLEREFKFPEDTFEMATINKYSENMLIISSRTEIEPMKDEKAIDNYERITGVKQNSYQLYQELADEKEHKDYELDLEKLVISQCTFELGFIILLDLNKYEQYYDFLKQSINFEVQALMKYLKFMIQRSRPKNLKEIILCELETISDIFMKVVGENEHEMSFFEEILPIKINQFPGELSWKNKGEVSKNMEFVLSFENENIEFESHSTAEPSIMSADKEFGYFKLERNNISYSDFLKEFSLKVPLISKELDEFQLENLFEAARNTTITIRTQNGYQCGKFDEELIRCSLDSIVKEDIKRDAFYLVNLMKTFVIGPGPIVNLFLRNLAPFLSPNLRDQIVYASFSYQSSLHERKISDTLFNEKQSCNTYIHPLSHYLNPERCPVCSKYAHIKTSIEGFITGINGFSEASVIVANCVLKVQSFAVINLCLKKKQIKIYSGENWMRQSQYLRGLIGGQYYKTAEQILAEIIESGNSSVHTLLSQQRRHISRQ